MTKRYQMVMYRIPARKQVALEDLKNYEICRGAARSKRGASLESARTLFYASGQADDLDRRMISDMSKRLRRGEVEGFAMYESHSETEFPTLCRLEVRMETV